MFCKFLNSAAVLFVFIAGAAIAENLYSGELDPSFSARIERIELLLNITPESTATLANRLSEAERQLEIVKKGMTFAERLHAVEAAVGIAHPVEKAEDRLAPPALPPVKSAKFYIYNGTFESQECSVNGTLYLLPSGWSSVEVPFAPVEFYLPKYEFPKTHSDFAASGGELRMIRKIVYRQLSQAVPIGPIADRLVWLQ